MCKDILLWLYLVRKNKIDAIQTLNCSKKDILDYYSGVESQELGLKLGISGGDSLKNALNVL